MNQTCYVPAGFRNACGKRSLGSYLTVEVQDRNGTVQGLRVRDGDKTLVFQAITSMYAGLDPWTIEVPRGMDDGLFEISSQGGAWGVAFFQIGCPTARAWRQGAGARIETSEPCYIQIDGEGEVVNGPALITVERAGSYPMIFKPREVT
jgi:diacylglycerol kinase (ATP)